MGHRGAHECTEGAEGLGDEEGAGSMLEKPGRCLFVASFPPLLIRVSQGAGGLCLEALVYCA